MVTSRGIWENIGQHRVTGGIIAYHSKAYIVLSLNTADSDHRGHLVMEAATSRGILGNIGPCSLIIEYWQGIWDGYYSYICFDL